MTSEVIIALIGGATTVVASLIAYLKDKRAKREANNNNALLEELKLLRESFNSVKRTTIETRLKANILDRLGELSVFNEIKNSVDRIFEKTRADRFLILFSLNGTRELRIVSVAFELHRKPASSSAIVRYRDVEIDDDYRALIKQLEKDGFIDLEREDMKPQLLKDFFTIEGINTIKLTFVERRHLDEENDIVIFGTVAAEETGGWTEMESAVINSEYEGTIKPIIRAFL